MALLLTDICKAADFLGVAPCVVWAVAEVEAQGSGFLPDGRVKILFEGHVFWRELAKRSVDPRPMAVDHADILYPVWDRSKYRSGAGEWMRLDEAVGIHREAALYSTSWGMFQIMGFNYQVCGYATVHEFVAGQKAGEGRQLDAFCAYIKSRGLAQHLKCQDWAAFARAYNGPGYIANRYDTKLAQAYARCKAGQTQ